MVTDLTVLDGQGPPPPALIPGGPTEIVERATEMANVLRDVIESRTLYANIQGKKHVTVEGWTTLGAMVGVFPSVEWTRAVEGGWEARCIAKTMAGNTVGAAEAQCTRSENAWRNRDDYALRSMAQTRAVSKAMRVALSWVMALAGFEPTPAEEMPHAAASLARQPAARKGPPAAPRGQEMPDPRDPVDGEDGQRTGQARYALKKALEAKYPDARERWEWVRVFGSQFVTETEVAYGELSYTTAKQLLGFLAMGLTAPPADDQIIDGSAEPADDGAKQPALAE